MMKTLLLLFALLLFAGVTAQSTASKNVSTFSLYWPERDISKKIWVYLPHNYHKKKKTFPVIYMPDGQNLFDKETSAYGEWRIDETLDSLKAEVIVIGIEHGGDNRINELTPYKNEQYGGGDADIYLDFMIHYVKRHVDKQYRTKKDRDNTAIMGSSLGGLTAYYAFINYPDTFGKAGVFSPSFWFTENIFELTNYSEGISGRLYFMAGDNEDEKMVPDLDKIESLVRKKTTENGFIQKRIVAGGKHNEALWSKEFAKACLWLMDEG